MRTSDSWVFLDVDEFVVHTITQPRIELPPNCNHSFKAMTGVGVRAISDVELERIGEMYRKVGRHHCAQSCNGSAIGNI